MPPASTGAELLGVERADHHGAAPAGYLHDPQRVLGGHLGGLVDHQDVARVDLHVPAGLVRVLDLAEELGDVPGIIGAPACSASSAMTRAALVLAVRPMTRPPVSAAQIRANAAMTWVLPVPAGATRQLISRAEVSRPRHGLPLGVIQVRAGQRRGRGLRRDPLRDRQPGHVHQVLLVVKVLAGDEPFLAGRPVDRRAVLAQAEPGHVDDVGHRGDLDDVHALGPAGQRLVGEAVEVRLRVDVGRQGGQRLAELEHQLAARSMTRSPSAPRRRPGG